MTRYKAKHLIQSVEYVTGINFGDITGPSRNREIVQARRLLAYALYRHCLTEPGLPSVAVMMNRPATSHTSVHQQVCKAKQLMQAQGDDGEAFKTAMANVLSRARSLSVSHNQQVAE